MDVCVFVGICEAVCLQLIKWQLTFELENFKRSLLKMSNFIYRKKNSAISF